jgi:ATP-dependent RNA helicase RhlE
MSFQDLGLDPRLLSALAREGYTQPTPIQQQAIPAVLSGRDLLAAAQTGTGKTAAFTLPLLHRFGAAPKQKAPRALILTPTRELAAQVAESVRVYGSDMPLRAVVIFGGVSINPQIDALRAGVDVVVATPGRLLDHLGQKTVDLSRIEVLVLDEADRMLDMGFIHDIRRVLTHLPKARQNLMFSATFSQDIRKLAEGLLQNPLTIDIAPRNSTAENVEQRVVWVDKSRKADLLAYLISGGDWKQTLVFTRTKHGANRLAEKLIKWGISSAALHGNKSQNARTRALAALKSGEIRVLVATDIAARGLDIDGLPHVVNFELPNVPEDYVHRIGRTGRAGAAGEAISLVSADEKTELRDIQKLLKRELEAFVVEGFEPGSAGPLAAEAEETPVRREPQGRGRGGNRAGGRGGAGVGAGGSAGAAARGPAPQRGRHGNSPRPQKDAERRAGKDRKVH